MKRFDLWKLVQTSSVERVRSFSPEVIKIPDMKPHVRMSRITCVEFFDSHTFRMSKSVICSIQMKFNLTKFVLLSNFVRIRSLLLSK